MIRLLSPLYAGMLAVLVTLAKPCPAAAQTEPAAKADSASVTIAEVNRALTDPSATVARSMTFRGVVAFVSHVGDLCVLDGPHGVMIEPQGDSPRPVVGDEVEVTASVKFQTADVTDPAFFLKAKSVRLTGAGKLPEPVPAKLGEALNGRYHMRWVEVEGVVMQSFMEHGVLFLHMTDASGWAVVNVHHWRGGDEMLSKGWGARLRVRCASVGRGHRALRVASSSQITLVQPGTAGLFDAPQAGAAALAAGSPSFDRLRLSGTVLAVHEGVVHIRAGDTAFRTSLLAPYVSASNPPLPLELIPPKVPELKPGDQVEAVGSPLKTKPWLEVSFASVRRVSPGDLPPARKVEGAALFTSAVCDRVQVRGEVQSRSEAAGRNGMVETLTLDAGGAALQARMESARGGQLSDFRESDVLELTGVLLPPSGGKTAQLLLTETPGRGQASVAVIRRGLPPVAIQTITILAGGLAVALAVAWWLQRQVRLRTAALADANTSLKVEAEALNQTRAELARALDQERELNELKSRFVSMVSHEFRTPLGITMSAVELLQHYQDRLPPEQKQELLGDIQRATKNMAGLMEQVLLLGRVEAGKLGFRPGPLDLETLSRKLTDESLSATNRRCPVEWTTENDLSGATGDEALLRHIFSNLLSNAVKYSPENSPVEFRARREGREAVITVQDRGIGIPAEEIPRLFEAFHRCSNVGDTPGTGLGLVIIKRCVDLHGGTITLDSKPGEGTTWTVRLPLWAE